MRVSVNDAKGQLAELVRLAEAGNDVVLTQQGKAAVRLVPVPAKPTSAEKEALLHKVMASGPESATDGADAAHSQDFLYDADGIPQ
jgi:prevent-host-death family protein